MKTLTMKTKKADLLVLAEEQAARIDEQAAMIQKQSDHHAEFIDNASLKIKSMENEHAEVLKEQAAWSKVTINEQAATIKNLVEKNKGLEKSLAEISAWSDEQAQGLDDLTDNLRDQAQYHQDLIEKNDTKQLVEKDLLQMTCNFEMLKIDYETLSKQHVFEVKALESFQEREHKQRMFDALDMEAELDEKA